MKHKWWKEAVAYQIYPRSFMDSNGDGIGDLQGIISKLDYLKELGIDVIWICPIFKSPNDDNGYDISDYKDIMDEFGSMSDFDQLMDEVHKRGMKLILDLVINHSSDEHPWFVESRSSKNSPYRDYYIWHPGRNGKEPNNWESIFGGSAWEFNELTNDYYLHVFSKKQPDLNWENAVVREALYGMVNWWLDKGIDGFRIDAISHIKKLPGFPDLPNPENKKYVPSFDGHMNRPGIQPFLQELKEKTFDHYDIMTVGEANGVHVEEAEDWVDEENGKFNMIFQFEHLGLWKRSSEGGLDLDALRNILTKWQKGLEGMGWNALFLENHDQPRSVSTWGNDQKHHVKSAKSLATLYFLMQGTPYIYQGQEIGMTNVRFDSIEDYNDVAIKNLYQTAIEEGKTHKEIMEVIWKNGRDNSRTPMQWSNTPQAGFSTSEPWLKVNPNYPEINVEASLADQNSIYHFYKSLIKLRKTHKSLVYGNYNLILKDHEYVYGYTRTLDNETIVVLCNLFNTSTEIKVPKAYENQTFILLLNNYNVGTEHNPETFMFQPYETRIYQILT